MASTAAGYRLSAAGPDLLPTQHPPLPGDPSLYWLLPDAPASNPVVGAGSQDEASRRFALGATLIAGGDFAAGLPLVSGGGLAGTRLAGYARYYEGLALRGLGRLPEAEAVLRSARGLKPVGYLKLAVALAAAEVASARRDFREAVDVLEGLSDDEVLAPEDVALRLGRAAELAGKTEKALKAYRRIYYEYPLSPLGVDAQAGIERLETPANLAPDRFRQALARAERLFEARRWAQSRAGFVPLARAATSADDRELIALRLAECDYYLGRARAARVALRPFVQHASRKPEARFFSMLATKALGERDAFIDMARAMVADFPSSSWTEDTLDTLARFHLVGNDDQAADAAFAEINRRFPKGRFAERAAWKSGWSAYKDGRFAEASEIFDAAAAAMPRADTRPAWLYWSARARDQAGDPETASLRYRLEVTDYQNTYYGRLAQKRLADRREPPVAPSVANAPGSTQAPMPTDALVRQLVSLRLYADALNELQYAQLAWGDLPVIQATMAWIRHEQGLGQAATERFQNLRGAIRLMKRAYPQYLTAGGENLPPEVLRIMFPLDYWPIIKKYADASDLDPYLMAALVAQESTFTAEIRSSGNAFGLMQLIPAAGRQYAKKAGLGAYSQRLLTQPESNVRMGTTYFKDLTNRFGGAHFALAGYNAGPHRVSRWISERPSVAQDEFIDDIPFPETQNYVKRILGTAEDYRRLYGPGGPLAPALVAAPAPTPSATAPGKPAPEATALLGPAPGAAASTKPAPAATATRTPSHRAPRPRR